MDPATIAALSSILGGVGGLFGGGGRLDPKELEKYFGVGALNKDTQKLFEFLKGSAFGQFGQQNAALQGSLFGDELKRRGAAIGGSGVGMIASSAAAATQAFQQGDFLSQLFAQSQSGAQENLGARLSAYTQGGNAPTGFGALAGAIANAGGQYSLLTGGGDPNSPSNARKVARNAVNMDMALNPPTIKKYDFSNLNSVLGPR